MTDEDNKPNDSSNKVDALIGEAADAKQAANGGGQAVDPKRQRLMDSDLDRQAPPTTGSRIASILAKIALVIVGLVGLFFIALYIACG